MRKYLLALMMTVFLVGLHAQETQTADSIGSLTEFAPQNQEAVQEGYSKQMGDAEYIQENYQKAIEVYEALLQDGESAEIYYNLGNAYYKSKDIARAVLNYERAVLLEPGNSDYRTNLEIAKSKTIDRVEVLPDLFFVSWYKSLVNTASVRTWSYLAISMFVIALLLMVLYLISKMISLKKVGFVGSLVALVLCIVFNVFAYTQKSRLVNRSEAIVLQPSVTVRSTPSETGTSVFVLHEGRKVTIKDDSMKEWKEISLEDGKVGWIPVSAIEVI